MHAASLGAGLTQKDARDEIGILVGRQPELQAWLKPVVSRSLPQLSVFASLMVRAFLDPPPWDASVS